MEYRKQNRLFTGDSTPEKPLGSLCTPTGPDDLNIKIALIEFYDLMQGFNWLNKSNTGWLIEASYCNWHGIECLECAPQAITSLSFLGTGLTGNMPAFGATIDSLESLVIDNNENLLSLWPDIGKAFPNLQHLEISRAAIKFLPDSIGELSALRYISFTTMGLVTMNPAVAQLTAMEQFIIHNNYDLSGPVLSLTKNMLNLTNLVIDFHPFYNENIPAFIGLFTQLNYLTLDTNKMTGPIPSSINQLTNLWALDLFNNEFNGNLPNISNLLNLRFLYLAENQLTGEIPNINYMTQLQAVEMESNKFTSIDPEFSLPDTVTDCHLQDNPLQCPIPTEASQACSATCLD